MPRLTDGSVISSYFDVDSPMTGEDISKQGMSFMIGQIEKIYFIDDSANISKKFVEYDVSIRDEKGGQSVFRNVRNMSSLYGTNDFEETVLESNEYAFSGKLNPSNFFANKNGTIVILGSINGSKDKPFIIGTLPHPRKSGAKRSDGIRKLGEFRGIQWEINKLGELTLTYLGDRSPNGKLVRESTGPTKINIDKDGILRITDNKNQKLEINRTNTTISFTNGTTTTLDGINDKVTIVTSSGAKAEIDGNNNTILLKDNGTGSLRISDDKVALGASSAELLQQISDQLQELITLFSTVKDHTHDFGNLGYTVGPPSPSFNTAWNTAASNLTTIRNLVEGIRGIL